MLDRFRNNDGTKLKKDNKVKAELARNEDRLCGLDSFYSYIHDEIAWSIRDALNDLKKMISTTKEDEGFDFTKEAKEVVNQIILDSFMGKEK